MKNFMGEQLQLWIGSGSSAHTLACATSLSVNINADSIDVSCKDTGKFGASIAGKISWDLSTDCLFAAANESGGSSNYVELVDAMIAGTPLTATWAVVENYDTANASGGDEDGHIFNATTKAKSANNLYSGKVVITSIALTADNGSLSTYSVSLQGKGAINKTSGYSGKPTV